MMRPIAPPHLAKQSADWRRRAPLSHCFSPLGYNLIRRILISPRANVRITLSHFPGPPCNYRYVFLLLLAGCHVDPWFILQLGPPPPPLVHSSLLQHAIRPSSSTTTHQTIEERPPVLPSTQRDALPLPIPYRKSLSSGSKSPHEKSFHSRPQRKL